jgi:hypothetical protein
VENGMAYGKEKNPSRAWLFRIRPGCKSLVPVRDPCAEWSARLRLRHGSY